MGGDLDHERSVRVGDGGAADAAMEADEVESAPAGDASALRNFRHGADRGELVVVARDDKNAARGRAVSDDRRGHAGEED